MSEAVAARIRPARAGDAKALLRICLLTGDAGEDASGREDDPDLIGLIYAAPYLALEPEYAFVLERDGAVCGYVLGAPDSHAFGARLEREWYPPLRRRLADPGPDETHWRGSDWARRRIHHPDPVHKAADAGFPAHAHIDLLPEAQGKGHGRALLETLMAKLGRAGVPGLHLGVSARNSRALAFYGRLGFAPLEETEGAVWMGRRLQAQLP